jgi:hypothetical protein
MGRRRTTMSIRRYGIGTAVFLGLLLLALFATSPVQAQESNPEGLVFDCLTDAGYEVLDVYGDDDAAEVVMEPVSADWDEDLRTQVVWGWYCLYPNYEDSEFLLSGLEYETRYIMAFIVGRLDFGDWLDGEMSDTEFASTYVYGVYDMQIGDWISETDFIHTYFPGAEPTIEDGGDIPRPGQHGGEPIFTDDFSDDDSGLPEGADNYAEFGYVSGEYHLEVLVEGRAQWVWYGDLEFDDFAIQAQARQVDGSEEGDYGLVVRVGPEGEEFYNFAISADGYYNIYKYDSDGWTELVGLTRDHAIQGDGEWDLLRVEAEGPMMSFLVNGEPLATVEDDDFTSGAIGFYAATYEDPQLLVAFDNLGVWTGETPSEGWTLVLEDDFSDDDSGWPAPLDTRVCEGDYDDDEYHLTSTSEDSCPVTLSEVYTDVAFELDARQLEGPEDSAYGILFRADDTDDPSRMRYTYAFAISSVTGEFGLFTCEELPEECTELERRESSSVNLDDDTNRLRVEAVGDTITLYANGDLLTTMEDAEIAEGRIGLVVISGARTSPNHVAFDNLKVYEPAGPVTGEPTFGPITWYRSLDEDGYPEEPITEYRRGTTQIIAGWDHENMQEGLEWGYIWYFDGEVVLDRGDELEWEGSEAGSWWTSIYYTSGNPLDSGDYEVELYIEGDLIQSASVRVR